MAPTTRRITQSMYVVVIDPSEDYQWGANIPSSQMQQTLAQNGLTVGTILRRKTVYYEVTQMTEAEPLMLARCKSPHTRHQLQHHKHGQSRSHHTPRRPTDYDPK